MLKNCSAAWSKCRGIEAREAVHHAVRGQNHETVGIHVDEGHHYGGFRVRGLRQLVGTVFRHWPMRSERVPSNS